MTQNNDPKADATGCMIAAIVIITVAGFFLIAWLNR
jgi:hypothetical protein